MGPKIVGVQNHRGECRYQGAAGMSETIRVDGGGWAWRGPQHGPSEYVPARGRTDANLHAIAAAMGEEMT